MSELKRITSKLLNLVELLNLTFEQEPCRNRDSNVKFAPLESEIGPGEYRYPVLAAGSYQLQVTPPNRFRFPSTVSDQQMQLLPDGPYQLDLNNDGEINSDTADVYQETTDANPDKDGWRNFAGLPWTTHIKKPLAYERDPNWYSMLNLTPVQ